jgi:hypothetical protein
MSLKVFSVFVEYGHIYLIFCTGKAIMGYYVPSFRRKISMNWWDGFNYAIFHLSRTAVIAGLE